MCNLMKCFKMMTNSVCIECVKIHGYACMDCKWNTAVRIKIEVASNSTGNRDKSIAFPILFSPSEEFTRVE